MASGSATRATEGEAEVIATALSSRLGFLVPLACLGGLGVAGFVYALRWL